MKRAERVAALVWTMAWRAGILGCKRQSHLFCSPCMPLSHHESMHFRIKTTSEGSGWSTGYSEGGTGRWNGCARRQEATNRC